MRDNTDTKIFKSLLWISRGLSVFLAGFVFFFLIAHLVSDGFSQFTALSTREYMMLFAFALMVVGSLVALKFQLWGGVITICGYLFFALLNKNFWPGSVIPLFLMTGLLHVYLWLRLGAYKEGKPEGVNQD